MNGPFQSAKVGGRNGWGGRQAWCPFMHGTPSCQGGLRKYVRQRDWDASLTKYGKWGQMHVSPQDTGIDVAYACSKEDSTILEACVMIP